jgi:hypothetical protein
VETAGAVKRSFKGEHEANASRYKRTILQEHEITHLAENKHQSPKLLDTNRQRWVFAVATAFDFAAATFRRAPLTLRPPFALYPEQTFMQKFRNCLKTSKKRFSGRYRVALFRIPQPSSVKLTRQGGGAWKLSESIVRGEL